jgi:hypothetical protein
MQLLTSYQWEVPIGMVVLFSDDDDDDGINSGVEKTPPVDEA